MASCAANFSKLFNLNIYHASCGKMSQISSTLVQVRNYAARKGTRERRLKLLRAAKNKKQELQKKEQPRKMKFQKENLLPPLKRNSEHKKSTCSDDVIIGKFYRWQVYSFAEGIQCHRETHHPTMYNKPDALVTAHIELDMKGAKKNRFVEQFTRIVPFPHIFPSGEERTVVAFCNTEELQQAAKDAGANLVGGGQLIKEIEKGSVSVEDVDYVVAHPNIVPELIPIRGLIKKWYPSVRAGTLGVDIASMVKKFRHGVKYIAKRDEREPDFGHITVCFGKLDMELDHLQENMQTLLRDVYSVRPKRPGYFITRLLISSEPSVERLKLDLDSLLPEQVEETQNEEDSDEEENINAAKA